MSGGPAPAPAFVPGPPASSASSASASSSSGRSASTETRPTSPSSSSTTSLRPAALPPRVFFPRLAFLFTVGFRTRHASSSSSSSLSALSAASAWRCNRAAFFLRVCASCSSLSRRAFSFPVPRHPMPNPPIWTLLFGLAAAAARSGSVSGSSSSEETCPRALSALLRRLRGRRLCRSLRLRLLHLVAHRLRHALDALHRLRITLSLRHRERRASASHTARDAPPSTRDGVPSPADHARTIPRERRARRLHANEHARGGGRRPRALLLRARARRCDRRACRPPRRRGVRDGGDAPEIFRLVSSRSWMAARDSHTSAVGAAHRRWFKIPNHILDRPRVSRKIECAPGTLFQRNSPFSRLRAVRK